MRNLPPAASVPPSASRHPGRCSQLFCPWICQETRASLGTKRNRIWMLHRAWPNQSCVSLMLSQCTVCPVKNENCHGAGSMAASLSCELQFLSGQPLTASSKLAGPRSISVVILFHHPIPPQITAEVTATIFPNGTLFMNWAGPPDGGGIERY